MATPALSLFAETTTSPLYYQTLKIAKIYPMEQGYRVVYRTPVGTLRVVYIPMSWFGSSSSKAVLIPGNNPAYPYMAVYWNKGKFDFVKLYVKSNPDDSSWGSLPPGFNTKGKFPTNGKLTIQWK